MCLVRRTWRFGEAVSTRVQRRWLLTCYRQTAKLQKEIFLVGVKLSTHAYAAYLLIVMTRAPCFTKVSVRCKPSPLEAPEKGSSNNKHKTKNDDVNIRKKIARTVRLTEITTTRRFLLCLSFLRSFVYWSMLIRCCSSGLSLLAKLA